MTKVVLVNGFGKMIVDLKGAVKYYIAFFPLCSIWLKGGEWFSPFQVLQAKNGEEKWRNIMFLQVPCISGLVTSRCAHLIVNCDKKHPYGNLKGKERAAKHEQSGVVSHFNMTVPWTREGTKEAESNACSIGNNKCALISTVRRIVQNSMSREQ